MNIYISGVTYKTTPLEIREQLSFNGEEQRKALREISKLPCVAECVLLSTCNRTEAYLYSADKTFDNSLIEKALCDIKRLDSRKFKKYFNSYRDDKAVQHLFKVACGLDSMVLGEDQILGQVKSAYELSLELGASSSVLNTLFQDAIAAAKKVKTSTGLSKNSVSIGALTVKLVYEEFAGKLGDKCALVIGAGKIGAAVLKNLSARGIAKIYLTNRSHGKAEDLSKTEGIIRPIAYNDRYSVINECDILVSSTSSPHYTITRDVLEKHLAGGKRRVFIDLAVPRDLDESLKDIRGVTYYHIDHLQKVADENIGRRMVEAARAEQIIGQFVADYEKWYEFRSVLPVVNEVQRFTEAVLEEKISAVMRQLKNVSEAEQELVKLSLTSAVNEIMNKFVYSVREKGDKDDVRSYFRCLRNVFKENRS
jgi:glutamyl-tRNA reductase